MLKKYKVLWKYWQPWGITRKNIYNYAVVEFINYRDNIENDELVILFSSSNLHNTKQLHIY